MRRTDFIMGMPVVIDVPGLRSDRLIEAAFNNLKAADAQFSPFKPDSELSRFNKRQIMPSQLSIGMKAVMKACLDAEKLTGGYFSARHSGGFDPTGYVKGWAISEAKRLFLKNGLKTFCISAGGDIASKSSGRKIWKVGIQDPRNPKAIIAKVVGKNFAVATSGNYERGQHIINPKTGQPAQELLSITVTGPDIIKADVFATAAFAMGKKGMRYIDGVRDYEVFALANDGQIMLSDGMAEMLEGDLAITGKIV